MVFTSWMAPGFKLSPPRYIGVQKYFLTLIFFEDRKWFVEIVLLPQIEIDCSEGGPFLKFTQYVFIFLNVFLWRSCSSSGSCAPITSESNSPILGVFVWSVLSDSQGVTLTCIFQGELFRASCSLVYRLIVLGGDASEFGVFLSVLKKTCLVGHGLNGLKNAVLLFIGSMCCWGLFETFFWGSQTNKFIIEMIPFSWFSIDFRKDDSWIELIRDSNSFMRGLIDSLFGDFMLGSVIDSMPCCFNLRVLRMLLFIVVFPILWLSNIFLVFLWLICLLELKWLWNMLFWLVFIWYWGRWEGRSSDSPESWDSSILL